MGKWLLVASAWASCTPARTEPPVPSHQAEGTAIGKHDERFEGTLAGHHFSIEIPDGESTGATSWRIGGGTLELSESGPVDGSTQFLIQRSPRTIARSRDGGVSIITEVVVAAGGRMFTCLHAHPVADDASPEAKAARERGISVCSTLHVDP